MRLAELCRRVPGAQVPEAGAQLDVRSVQSDSRDVVPGDIFVAVPGEATDGRQHAAQAVSRGAIAVVSQTPLDVPVPVVLVRDARMALGQLAAEHEGMPAERLQLVGITGTMGKTSVLAMLSEILVVAGIRAGSVGSLGIEQPAGSISTANTTPGALQLQQAMAKMVRDGVGVMAMEVTSHALLQGRIHGLSYDLGVITNLAMLEHMEYHGSFRDYAEAKRQFLHYLKPGAPIVHAAGDRVVSAMVARHPGPLIACGGHPGATVSVRRGRLRLDGARIALTIRQPLPRLGDDALQPLTVPLELNTIGRTNISNATLAAVAALCLGVEPASIQAALAGMPAPPRRLQVVRPADPCIIDDTVGHPDSITGVFEVVRAARYRRLIVVFCVRGQRGPVINQRDAEAVAIWSRQVPIDTLVVTSASDTADERNTVSGAERDAFLRVLENEGLPFTHHDRLRDAVESAVTAAGRGDLLLLLGAQGMDAGARMALESLEQRQPPTDARQPPD
jgi:UDP-N-acetylmuramoyl-L-alanyl-D-glutamate--2,6-diaminopimelate ligase